MSNKDYRIAVIVDDRESKSEVIKFLSETKNVSVGIKRLSLGDYLVDNRLVFERKTLNDFALSIIDGRLFSQAIRFPRIF
jgi:Fanconi anemia group M protein